jgi:integrase
MPRDSKPPTYRLHRARNCAVIRFRGKDVYLTRGKYGTPESLEEFQEYLARWHADQAALKLERAKLLHVGPTLDQIMVPYLSHVDEWYRKGGEATSQAGIIRATLRVVHDLHGGLEAHLFDSVALEQVRDELIRRGHCRREVNRRVCVIRQFIGWCVGKKLVGRDVLAGIDRTVVTPLQAGRCAAHDNPPVGPVADEHVDAILHPYTDKRGTVRDPVTRRIADAIRLLRMTGARAGEILSLTADQIDRRDPELWCYRLADHKTAHHGKGREIFFPPAAQEILRPWLIQAGNGRLFAFRVDSLRQAIERGCRRTGTPVWHPHQIRHTVATEVREKYGAEAAQAVLGHATLDTTQLYAEKSRKLAIDVARRLG